jgi:hypothetical protein
MGRAEGKFAVLTQSLDEVLLNLRGRKLLMAPESSTLEQHISSVVENIQRVRLSCLDTDDMLTNQLKENAFLLSRKTDATRQAKEARRLLDENDLARNGMPSKFTETQPLDFESERRRRQLAASAMYVKEKIGILNERAELLKKCSAPDESETGTQELLRSIMALFDHCKSFDQSLFRVEEKLSDISKCIPIQLSRPKGLTTYGLLSPSNYSRQVKIRPLPIPGEITSPIPKRRQHDAGVGAVATEFSKWQRVESSLQSLASVPGISVKLWGLSRISNKDPLAAGQRRTAPERSRRVALLLSPSTSGKPLGGSDVAESSIILFSPRSSTKPRGGWDLPSSVDQANVRNMSVSAPRELKEVSIAAASRDALAPFGTTPEKLRASLEVKMTEGISGSSSRQARSSTPSATGDEQAARKSSKQTHNPSTALTPMPSAATFSQKTSLDKAPSPRSPKGDGSLSYPPISKSAPRPFSSKEPSSSGDSKLPLSKKAEPSLPDVMNKLMPSPRKSSSSEQAPNFHFGDMKGLESSLFTLPSKPEPMAKHPPQTSGEASSPDFKTLLTSFYQKHNPSKLFEVEKTLEKYKVSFIGRYTFEPIILSLSQLGSLV